MFIALLTGVFQAMIGWAVDLTPKQLVSLFIVNIGTLGLAYLAKHPNETIVEESFSSDKQTLADGSTRQLDVHAKQTTPVNPDPSDLTKL